MTAGTSKTQGKKNERGQALILIVFAIIGLVGMTALAVDGGNAYVEQRRTQNAADTVALGGALARLKGNTWISESYNIASSNGFNNDGVTNSVSIVSPPSSGPYAGDTEYIQVRITYKVPTYFAGVVGVRELTVSAEAVSRTKRSEIKEILEGNAIVSLAPKSDCNNNRAFWVHGESTLDISGGGIFINSDNKECALFTNGSGSIRIQGGGISIVGAAKIQKPNLITPFPPKTNTPPLSYPPPFFMPKVGCGDSIAEVQEDGVTMSPGNYDEDIFPPDDVQFLESGTYCINGDFFVDGFLEGNGVTIKMESGRIRFGGSATVILSAPKSGDLAGLLLYAPIENTNLMSFSGDLESNLQGTILMPGADIQLNGGDSPVGYRSQIIGYRIESKGQSNIVIKYDDDMNYDTYSMPEIQLIK
jgi:hypothetical protein